MTDPDQNAIPDAGTGEYGTLKITPRRSGGEGDEPLDELFLTPRLRLAGEEYQLAWNQPDTFRVPVGTYQLTVWVPYGLLGPLGEATSTVEVEAGAVHELEYRAPRHHWRPGWLGTPPPALEEAIRDVRYRLIWLVAIVLVVCVIPMMIMRLMR